MTALPDAFVSVTLGGHSAVAEYDDDDDPIDGGDRGGNQHNRISSSAKFQWQSMLGNSLDTITDDNAHVGTGVGGGSTRTSRCYSARTRTVRRSVNPVFNEEFRFEVADDTLLQDEPLLFHVWDLTDSLMAKGGGGGQHGSIGLVYVDLNPLLTRTAIDAAGMDNEKSGSGGGGNEDQSGGNSEGRHERSSSFSSTSSDFNVTGSGDKGGLSAGVIDGW